MKKGWNEAIGRIRGRIHSKRKPSSTDSSPDAIKYNCSKLHECWSRLTVLELGAIRKPFWSRFLTF